MMANRNIARILTLCTISIGCVFPALAADDVRASYDVSFAGARIMKANYSATLSDGAYTAALDAKSVGVSKLISKIKLNLNASGRLVKSDVLPSSYNYSRKKNDKRKERSLSFKLTGELVTAGTDYDDAILNAMNASVMDPLSMLLKLSRGKAPCSGKHRAFDGRDVFDITLRPGKQEGTTLVCKATYTPVAGGDVEDGDTAPKQYELTLVPLGSAEGYIPVRIAGTSKGVGFDVSATSVSVNGTEVPF